VDKSEIRKKIFKLRKNFFFKKKFINPGKFLKFLEKINIKNKIIGGYYPYNYEIDSLDILKKLEKKII
jgi:5-formyltetrahydrofolate cyclo-ligase